MEQRVFQKTEVASAPLVLKENCKYFLPMSHTAILFISQIVMRISSVWNCFITLNYNSETCQEIYNRML